MPWIGAFEKDPRALVLAEAVKLEVAQMSTSFCIKRRGRVRLTITSAGRSR